MVGKVITVDGGAGGCLRNRPRITVICNADYPCLDSLDGGKNVGDHQSEDEEFGRLSME